MNCVSASLSRIKCYEELVPWQQKHGVQVHHGFRGETDDTVFFWLRSFNESKKAEQVQPDPFCLSILRIRFLYFHNTYVNDLVFIVLLISVCGHVFFGPLEE
jgi:hypothetical protein